MKKILTVLLAVAIVFSMSVSVFAEVENFAKDIKWAQGYAGGISNKDGIAKATGIKAAYNSPFIDIYPAVKAALGTDTDAELIIRFKVRADFTEGNEGEISSARTLLRAGSIKAEEVEDWNANYSEATDGESFFYSDKGGNIMHYFSSGFSFTDEEWTTVIIELEVSDTIVNCDLTPKWNFCLDTIGNPGIIESLQFKEFIVAHYDDSLLEVEDEPVEVEKPEKEEKPESNEPVSNENFAANLKWTGFSGATITEGADGVTTVTNFKYPYSSPAVNVLPTFKKALGDDDNLEIYIMFDIRAVFTEGNEDATVTASSLFRGENALSVKASDVDEWKEAYSDSFEDSDPYFTNSQGNIMKYLGQGIEMTSEWKTHVIELEIEAEQITNPSISKWNLCFDNMSADYTLIDKVELKNFVITLEEPEIEEEEKDEKPATDDKPADNPADTEPDPNATPTPFVVWQTPIGYTENGFASGSAGNDGAPSLLPVIIGCAVGAVVVIGGIITAVVLKKKKPAKTEE